MASTMPATRVSKADKTGGAWKPAATMEPGHDRQAANIIAYSSAFSDMFVESCEISGEEILLYLVAVTPQIRTQRRKRCYSRSAFTWVGS
jgi:hypothetical protein